MKQPFHGLGCLTGSDSPSRLWHSYLRFLSRDTRNWTWDLSHATRLFYHWATASPRVFLFHFRGKAVAQWYSTWLARRSPKISPLHLHLKILSWQVMFETYAWLDTGQLLLPVRVDNIGLDGTMVRFSTRQFPISTDVPLTKAKARRDNPLWGRDNVTAQWKRRCLAFKGLRVNPQYLQLKGDADQSTCNMLWSAKMLHHFHPIFLPATSEQQHKNNCPSFPHHYLRWKVRLTCPKSP